ncbi:MAG TPA: Hint domain-containing protein, partial [Acetobacteraceae bacterium]|nr:Hint domain-containing protein [Acetobacteraceae bacterium]
VTINGFEISGVSVSSGNGAAIRYEGGTLTLNNDFFHNNEDGMLAASDPSGSITISHSEFAFNGTGDGQTHNLYVNDVGTLTITGSYFHDANVGHEIKSRAENTTITNTRIFDNSSPASYSIDLPNGGNATIQNNTIEKGANSQNGAFISYGEEGLVNTGTTVLIANNTFVNDRYSAVAVTGTATTPLLFQNNQLYGMNSGQIGSPVSESGTTYLSTRPTLDTSSLQAPCFAEGTRILTARGEVPVQALTESDRIVTGSGALQRLVWLGHRRIDLRRHPRRDLAAPVRICRDAFGPGMPRRDLRVSPDHCLFVDGGLIPAKLLINGMTIVLERETPSVTYYHVELERHAILLAENLPVESYLDTGNRALFANAGLALVLHPEFQVNTGLKHWAEHACAPLTVAPDAVEPVWRRLATRARALGCSPPNRATTEDPLLRVQVQGRTLRSLACRNGRAVFALPPGTQAVRLTSRSTVPSHTQPWVDDWRRLGVAVRRLELRCGGDRMPIALDGPGLAAGWHAVERDDASMWRWTNGDAVVDLLDCSGPMLLEVDVAITLRYPVADAQGTVGNGTSQYGSERAANSDNPVRASASNAARHQSGAGGKDLWLNVASR